MVKEIPEDKTQEGDLTYRLWNHTLIIASSRDILQYRKGLKLDTPSPARLKSVKIMAYLAELVLKP